MNYDNLIDKAIKNNEVLDLLCGKKDYEIEVSKFTSEVFPTDINAILVNCFYKQFKNIEGIQDIFEESLKKMLKGSPSNIYIATLYFDTCIFQEDIGKAKFSINRKELRKYIKEAVDKNRLNLSKEIVFENGLKKYNPLKSIENFSEYYEKKYKFSIV